ncbi:hypothetical protein HMPREF1084_02993 [Clostridium butyricum 60E.3]|uniref:flagellin lysine-N-methylase n=1 Tax=Clostridium butyricum TaxID=1492 RepID=UPI0002D15CA8|nr:flagellin lysine-N-methylase [Clostridium butyricum]ENZ31474.1 hypothetical protein HMPREF1084_02993 [Clostridium butyricum 60E.3]MDU5720685.1 flagellin lysine-N-methylase [Clostridium butyricum]MDU5818489.1 flagellin lysine-N-methylase [Clostridium butyricum]
MKVLKPDYYEKFQCIANDCNDSCCIGWSISIDKKSYNKYKKISGEFGKVLNKNISKNRINNSDLNYGKMKLILGKCSFLNEDNLCNIYINLGEKSLCNTCKTYPRLINKNGEICEKNLTLSCPEVARLIISIKDKFGFELNDELIPEGEKDYINKKSTIDKSLYNFLWEVRSFMIEIAQFREIDLWKRLLFIILSEAKFQKLIEEFNYENLPEVIEILRNTITNIEFITSLDDTVHSVPKVKSLMIDTIITLRTQKRITNSKFKSFLSDFVILLQESNYENDNDYSLLDEKEREFNIYFKDKEYILENYIVYNLYRNFMNTINSKDIHEIIVKMIIEYSIIKKLLLARWNVNNKQLEDDDIIDALYSFSRTIEHDNVYIKEIYKSIKKAGYDTMAYMTIMFR